MADPPLLGTARVAPQGRAPWSLQVQQVAADRVAPEGATLFRVVTPKEPDRVSEFYYSVGTAGVPYLELSDKDVTYVYVDRPAYCQRDRGHDDVDHLYRDRHAVVGILGQGMECGGQPVDAGELRRRALDASGRAGMPKRPLSPRLPTAMAVIGLVVAVVYPL